MSNNKRMYSRVNTNIPVVVFSKIDEVEAIIKNISESGMLIEIDKKDFDESEFAVDSKHPFQAVDTLTWNSKSYIIIGECIIVRIVKNKDNNKIGIGVSFCYSKDIVQYVEDLKVEFLWKYGFIPQ